MLSVVKVKGIRLEVLQALWSDPFAENLAFLVEKVEALSSHVIQTQVGIHLANLFKSCLVDILSMPIMRMAVVNSVQLADSSVDWDANGCHLILSDRIKQTISRKTDCWKCFHQKN